MQQVLAHAARRGDAALVAKLLSMHADATLADHSGATPLMHALRGMLDGVAAPTRGSDEAPSHPNVINLFLNLGQPDAYGLHATDADGYTALSLALQQGLLDMAVRLLRAGARVTGTVQGGRPFLHAALLSTGSDQAKARVVQALLDAGCDVNERDSSGGGCTPLCYAPSASVASLLLRHGADTAAHDDEGLTALHWACIYGREDVVGTLLDAGVEVHAQDKFQWTALDYAKQAGCLRSVVTRLSAQH